VADPTITDKTADSPVVVPTTPGPLPGVDAATNAKLDAIEVDLRGGYVRSGENIAEDPDEYRDEQFVNVADLPSIIHAWALAALPHLADQPAPTGDARAKAVEAIASELGLARDGIGYEEEAVAEELVRKHWPADRDTETAALDAVRAQHEHTYLNRYYRECEVDDAEYARCATCGNLPNGTLKCPTLAATSLGGEQGV
jgi:hypothetical protein